MPVLTNTQKSFIVMRLAMYERPTDVCEQFKQRFNTEIDPRHVGFYSPETGQGKERLSQKWRQLFYEARTSFLEDASKIPIAHKAYRLMKLQKNFEWLEARKSKENIEQANRTLEQAAKESGGMFEKEDLSGLVGDNDKQVNFFQQINQKAIAINQQDRSEDGDHLLKENEEGR